jgi:hypothetical protein
VEDCDVLGEPSVTDFELRAVDLPPSLLSARPAAAVARLSNRRLLELASALFFAPNLVLAFGFHDLARAGLLVGCAIAASLFARLETREDGLLAQRVDLPALGGLFALALALLVLSGATHIFAPNPDWQVRDSVLADLALRGFAPLYRFGDVDYVLRAPLGMYLAPAVAGRAFGLYAAHVALLLQNAALLATTLYFFMKLSEAPKLPFVLVFIAFGWADQLIQLACMLSDREGWWNPFFFRYMSTATNLFWAPNHTLPGLWLGAAALLLARREIDLALFGATIAGLVLWSPFAVIGAVPFAIYFALRQSPRDWFAPRFLLGVGVGLAFTPIALYLTLDADQVPHKALAGASGFVFFYLAFMLVELPRAGIFYAAWSKIARSDRALLLVAAATLAAIPFYSMGPFNDFSMRGSQTALALVAFGFARIAATTPRDGKPLSLAIVTLTILTGFEALFELRFPLVAKTYAISDCNLAASTAGQNREARRPVSAPRHYMARAETAPGWLNVASGAPLRDDAAACWPTEPNPNVAR